MSGYGAPHRAAASSPILAPRPTFQAQASQEPSVRQMRLKVLYTFDEDKTNCLARWPHPLEIRTAFLSAETQIGVIELKTCLQAIATASPEIVAGLGQDYTVYAYDYSEYETPLVGQGMLSWILASASPTPGAPASQSRTMVTGRVSQNSLGLFSAASQETLDVKLRLVPVPTSRQSEYLESMKKYRDVSQMMPPGFDPQVWTTFLQQNLGFMQQAIQSRSQSPASGQHHGFGIEHVQRLLNREFDMSNPSHPRRQTMSRANSFANADAGHQLQRLPSPASSVASTATAPKRRGRKPGSNTKGPKPRRGKKEQPSESTDPGYCTGDERVEEGPSKKRAKVVQADWDGRQELGKQPDSLRVAASTAASVRIHQPTAVRPGSNAHLSLDSQPRAPTPIAGPSQRLGKPRQPLSKSNLGQSSHVLPDALEETDSPAPASEKAPELSPEKSQAESSPADIASSPPEVFGHSTAQSSPRLPEFPRNFDDSGFMTGSFDDLFGDDENRSLDEEDFAMAAQYSKRPDLGPEGMPEFRNDFLLEYTQQPSEQPLGGIQAPDTAEGAPDSTKAGTSTDLLPPIPASDPGRPYTLTRSQTWSGDQAPHPASDMGAIHPASVDSRRPASRGRARRVSDMGGQSGVRRKAVIQSRLANSIATGEIPPYCDHCGAIETPTWRKAWAKVHSGSPEHVRISDEEGGILAWQTLQTDSKGLVCLYRIIKKTLAKDDQGFKQMLLCNPCGMYLLTRKCMRPKEMWDKSQRDPDDKGNRESHGGGPPTEPGSSSNKPGGSVSVSFSNPGSPTNTNKPSDSLEREPQVPVLRRSTTSVGETNMSRRGDILDEDSTAAALQRAIRSSPHKFVGSQQAPIEIADLTPQPTRRVLFPSPTQSEKTKSPCDPNADNSGSLSMEKRATSKTLDKENRPPASEDDIDRFFNEEGYASANGFTSPSMSRSKYPWLNKTPTKSPSRTPRSGRDSLTTGHLLSPTTPKRTPTTQGGPLTAFTPFTAHLNQLLSDATAGSPGAHVFDFPTLPSLRNTPNSSRITNFDFSQLDSQDLISTDIPMPSSPPPWNFGSFDDTGIGGNHRLWEDPNLPNTLSSPQGIDNSKGTEASEDVTSESSSRRPAVAA